MNIDIRKSIINNFKNSGINDIKDSIESSIKDKDEITLPGIGVFFEILWNNSEEVSGCRKCRNNNKTRNSKLKFLVLFNLFQICLLLLLDEYQMHIHNY